MSGRARAARAAAVALLVVAAVGCGSDESSAGADATSGTAATTSPSDGVPVPSPGCTGGDPTIASTTDGRFTSGGVERTFVLHVPSAHGRESPVPLVLDMPGYGTRAARHSARTQMAALGEREGFVTVTPQGLGEPPVLTLGRGGVDTRFLGELLDWLERGLCIDTSREYVTGFSGGAMMTSLLACTAADRFAAAAPVGGHVVIRECSPTRTMPIRAFHGTADPFQPMDGNIGPGLDRMRLVFGAEQIDTMLSEYLEVVDEAHLGPDSPLVVEVVAGWAERNGCAPTTQEHTVVEGVRRLVWAECPTGGPVELVLVDGGGHTWPGSDLDTSFESTVGASTGVIDATALIWDFFERHHR